MAAIAIWCPSAEIAGAARTAPSPAFHSSDAEPFCSFHKLSANSREDRYNRESGPNRGDDTPAEGTGNEVTEDSGDLEDVIGMDQRLAVGFAMVATNRRLRPGAGALGVESGCFGGAGAD